MAFPVIATILQGVVLTAVGYAAYEAGDGWFKAGTSNKFDSKETAQATLVGWLLISGWLGPRAMEMIQAGLLDFTFWQEVGLILLASRLLVNEVAGWTQTDTLSLVQFTVGSGLLVLPIFGYNIPL